MKYTGFHRFMSIVHRSEVLRCWQVHLGNEIRVDALDRIRQDARQAGLNTPSYTALVIKAIADSMRELIPTYPQLNAMITGIPGWKSIHTFDRISMGVAISRVENGDDSVVVGVIEDPDTLTPDQITAQLKAFTNVTVKETERLRNCHYIYRAPWPVQWVMGKLGHKVPELRRRYRGTVSLTTVGKFGVDWQLSLPQAGATIQFGFGNIRERPVVIDGQVVAKKTFNLTLSFDRLVMNGKPCAELMEGIRNKLQGDLKALPSQTAPRDNTPNADPQAVQGRPNDPAGGVGSEESNLPIAHAHPGATR